MSKHYRPDLNTIREAVKGVNSWRALALALGLPYPSSTIYKTVRPFCKRYNIDTSHFLGQAHNRGKRLPEQQIDINLYLTNEIPIRSHALKLKLIEHGMKEHKCEVCKREEWEGRPIPIQLHHLDGNSANNAFDNLQIICPNCHAQTETYCAKNHKHKAKPRDQWVSDAQICQLIPLSVTIADLLRELGLSLAQGHYNRVRRVMSEHPELKLKPKLKRKRNPEADPYWRIRPKPEQRKYQRPSKEELNRLVWEKPSEQVAHQLGISGTLLCRWCDDYGIAKPPRGYWSRRAAGKSHTEAIKPYVPPTKQIQKRFTTDQVLEIIHLLNDGQTKLTHIAKRFSVSNGVIIDIREGRTYKHVSRQNGRPTENLTHDVRLEKTAD